MQLVLLDTSNYVEQHVNRDEDTNWRFLMKESLLCPGINLKRKEGDDGFHDKDRRRKLKLISEIKTEDMGSLCVILKLQNDARKIKMSVVPCFTHKSIFKNLVQKFQEKVKISLYLQRHSGREMVDFASIEGMTIHPEMFICTGTGTGSTSTNITSLFPRPLLHVKLIAEIPECYFMKRIPFARKVLKAGAPYDIIISAGNGREIKAHKALLVASSPVFERMFGYDMRESATGRVDMSDASAPGVQAFIDYLYHGDLTEPREDVEIAFELLRLGHKYGMSTLETDMLGRLLRREDRDFSVELALEMYMFMGNIDSALAMHFHLKKKLVLILKRKSHK